MVGSVLSSDSNESRKICDISASSDKHYNTGVRSSCDNYNNTAISGNSGSSSRIQRSDNSDNLNPKFLKVYRHQCWHLDYSAVYVGMEPIY